MRKIMSTCLLAAAMALVPVVPTEAKAVAVPLTDLAAESMDFGYFDLGYISDYAACPRGTFRVRKHTRTKKKVINSAIAGGVGAALGGAMGGGRGALAGAGIGAGGYLTYRYIKDRHGRCVRSYSRG